MEEGMPISKIHKMPVECFDESLEVIERQASELFEEFLRLPQPAERRASTRLRTNRGIPRESDEADEDDMVPDSMPPPGNPVAPPSVTFERTQSTADPEIQRLARQMQQAGDALCMTYKGRFEGNKNCLVNFVLENAASLTYDRLCTEIDSVVGRDRSWSNFAMVMCLGKRVAVETINVCGSVSEHFSRYIGRSYGPSIKQAGGMENFMRSGRQ